LPLTIREVPIAIPRIREAVQWHISNNNDPAIRWVVERLMAVAAEKPETRTPSNVVALDGGRVKALSHDEISAYFKSTTIPAPRS